jgi:hypothetical protein
MTPAQTEALKQAEDALYSGDEELEYKALIALYESFSGKPAPRMWMLQDSA